MVRFVCGCVCVYMRVLGQEQGRSCSTGTFDAGLGEVRHNSKEED